LSHTARLIKAIASYKDIIEYVNYRDKFEVVE